MSIPVPLYMGAEVVAAPANGHEECQCRKHDDSKCTFKAVIVRKYNQMIVPMCGVHNNVFERGNDVRVFGAQQQVTNEVDNNNKEEKVSEDSFIYHFLMEKVEEGEVLMPRIITDIPSESERLRYNASVISKKPETELLALNTGTWDFHLLRQRLLNKGLHFRIMILTNKEIRNITPEAVIDYHSRSTFAWANDSHTYFMRIENAEWGLLPLGLIDKDVAKLMKRFAEICRLSELAYYNETMNIDMVSRRPVGDIEFYDGMNYISLKFALKLTNLIVDKRRRNRVRKALINGTMTRFNIRVLTPLGLIKGDACVIDDLDHEFVFHPENLKSELRTTGWCLATMTHHNPLHMAVWDSQTWINNRNVLPEVKQRRDVDFTIQELRNSLEKGELPSGLMMGEELHDDSGLPDYERLSELLHYNNMYWQAHVDSDGNPLRITAIQNAVYMWINGLTKRMKRELRLKPVRYYKKTWTRMTNAFLAGITTRESIENMTNVRVKQNDGYLAWDGRFGLVMSGERFATTYSLHGGWDLDDSVKVILLKIWSSDPKRTLMLLESGALDPKCVVRAKESEATHVAFLVRSPNGPGEYSIEALNPDNWDSMPWQPLNEDLIPVVDLVNFPDPQTELVKSVTISGIPTSLFHDGLSINQEQSLAAIEAQRFNPGIGMICNCLMNWVMTVGTSFPPNMLALLEQMVDTTQQLRDPVSFQAIAEEVNNLYQQMVDRVNAENLKVDGLLAIAHPIPSDFADQMKARMVAGRFSRFNNYFGYMVDKLETEIMNKSLQMRHEEPIVQWARKIPVTTATLQWASSFNWRYNQEMRMNAELWTSDDEDKNPFAKMHFEMMRSAANKATIAKAIEELQAFGGDNVHKRVLSLWSYILRVKDRNPWGSLDRLIFQPGEDKSIMHLLVEALHWYGKVVEVIPMPEED
jgi:hypothetical protein